MEIIHIRHACNYRYFIQTGGARTSLGILGIILPDAKWEVTGDRLTSPQQEDANPAQDCLVGQCDTNCAEPAALAWASQRS